MLSDILRNTPRLLVLACAAIFFAAYLAVRFPEVPGAELGSYAATLTIALPAFVALFRYLGVFQAALSLLTLTTFAYVIELVGVATGFPYGEFFYGEALGPKAFGLVPYILPVSYLPLVIGAVAAVRSGSRVLWVVSAALLLTLVDGVLDPGAAALGFWVWPDGGPYYGVPLSNFAGWMFSGLLASALLAGAGRWRTPPLPGLLDSVVLAVSFWTGVAVFSALPLAALLGIFLLAYFLHRRATLAGKVHAARVVYN